MWQKGMPQSMQRAAWSLSPASGYGRYTSRQSCRRSATARVGGFFRAISRNPVTLPTDADSAQLEKRRLAADRGGS